MTSDANVSRGWKACAREACAKHFRSKYKKQIYCGKSCKQLEYLRRATAAYAAMRELRRSGVQI